MVKVEEYKDERLHYWLIKYNELELLRFTKLEEDKCKWIWFSEEMHVEDAYVSAETFDEAVDVLKDKAYDFYNDKLAKYESIVRKLDLSRE